MQIKRLNLEGLGVYHLTFQMACLFLSCYLPSDHCRIFYHLLNFFIANCYLWKNKNLEPLGNLNRGCGYLSYCRQSRGSDLPIECSSKHVQWRLGERCKMHLREEASKHLSLMTSFIFIVTLYVFIFKSNNPLLLSFQKTI